MPEAATAAPPPAHTHLHLSPTAQHGLASVCSSFCEFQSRICLVGLVACVSALQRSLWCQGWWGVLQEELSQAGPQETLTFCTTRCYSKQHFHHLRVLLILKSLCCSLAGLLAISPSAHPPQATAFAVLFECSQGNSAFHMATQHRHCLLTQPFPDHRILGRPLSHHSILPLPCSCLSELVVLKQGRC